MLRYPSRKSCLIRKSVLRLRVGALNKRLVRINHYRWFSFGLKVQINFQSNNSKHFVLKCNLNPTPCTTDEICIAEILLNMRKVSKTFIVSSKCRRVTCQQFPLFEHEAKIVRVMKCKVYHNHVRTLETTLSSLKATIRKLSLHSLQQTLT